MNALQGRAPTSSPTHDTHHACPPRPTQVTATFCVSSSTHTVALQIQAGNEELQAQMRAMREALAGKMQYEVCVHVCLLWVCVCIFM